MHQVASSQAVAARRPVPLSGAPRAIEHGPRKPAVGATPGETGVFRNAMVSELATTYRGATNLRELFEGVLQRHGNRPAQGTRAIEVSDVTWRFPHLHPALALAAPCSARCSRL